MPDQNETHTAQPTSATDGGDGSHASVSSKTNANTWTPFEPPDPPAGMDPAPATVTDSTGDDTEIPADGLANL